MNTVSIREIELVWYAKHGRYRDRITTDRVTGKPYVIGDWSWNMKYPQREEWIEDKMKSDQIKAEARGGK